MIPFSKTVIPMLAMAFLGGATSSPSAAADKAATEKKTKIVAPTVSEAMKVFDPDSLPLLETEHPVEGRYVGGFTYAAKGDSQAA